MTTQMSNDYTGTISATRRSVVAIAMAVALADLCMQFCWQTEVASARGSAKKSNAASNRATKQVYELSNREQHSQCLNASGVAAYVVSAGGKNRGLLLRNVENGFASSIGMQPGDILLSINGHVIQTGSDADRVLGSTDSGPGRVVFVHQSDAGLQLYNAPVNLPKFAIANMSGTGSSTTGSSSDSRGANSNSFGSSSAGGGKAQESMQALESYAIELINHDRQANGSPSISVNAALTSLARGHAQDMATRDFFGHVNPDGNDPQARARIAGLRCGVFENIAYQNGFDTGYKQLQISQSMMMNEPKNQQNHRSNILDPSHAAVGVGVVRARNGKLYLVQEFSHDSP